MQKKKIGHTEKTQWKCMGSVLHNDKTFDFYGIEQDDTITTNVRVNGGNILKK